MDRAGMESTPKPSHRVRAVVPNCQKGPGEETRRDIWMAKTERLTPIPFSAFGVGQGSIIINPPDKWESEGTQVGLELTLQVARIRILHSGLTI